MILAQQQKKEENWEEMRREMMDLAQELREEGIAEGVERSIFVMGREMIMQGVKLDIIKRVTGLTDDEIDGMRQVRSAY